MVLREYSFFCHCSAHTASFSASDTFKKSPEAFYFNVGPYQLLCCADGDQQCHILSLVDDPLSFSSNAMGVLVGQPSKMLQRCGDEVFSRKLRSFLWALLCFA